MKINTKINYTLDATEEELFVIYKLLGQVNTNIERSAKLTEEQADLSHEIYSKLSDFFYEKNG